MIIPAFKRSEQQHKCLELSLMLSDFTNKATRIFFDSRLPLLIQTVAFTLWCINKIKAG